MDDLVDAHWDAVIVGSGPGGSTLARELSRAGRRVVVLERGRDHRDRTLYGTYPGAAGYTDRAGLLFTREGMNVIRPLMVGGATSMYCGSAAPPPRWLEDRYGIDLTPHVEETVEELGIAPLPEGLRGRASRRIAEAARELGMEWEPQPKFMSPDRTSRFDCGAKCMLGCRCGAKWNAGEYLDDAVRAGCRVATGARVEQVLREDGRAVGVEGRRGGEGFRVKGEVVVLAAGGIGSPVILRASGLSGAGRGLAMDPTLMVYGAVDDEGIAREPPMTYGWTDPGRDYMLSTLIDPWLVYPLILIRAGRLRHALSWPRWGRTLGVMVKLKDGISGELRADGAIHKPISDEEERRLEHGIRRATDILLQAGCDPDSIFPTPLRGTHPSATVRLGEMLSDDLETEIPGLYVCDASTFPEALGAPTVLTIISLARRLADHLTRDVFSPGATPPA